MNTIIKIENLTKYYGKFKALSSLNLDVQSGEIYAFIGPNGSGKTTTIRILLGMLNATEGSVEILGKTPTQNNIELFHDIGYLPGELSTYDNLTGKELLTFFGNLKNVKDWPYIDSITERLQYDTSKKIKNLSKGNKQKVGIVQAFMKSPKLLILDEPTGGLDPNLQREFRKLLEEEKHSGTTILLSSHDLLEIQNTCDRVTIIKDGSVIASQSKEELNRKSLTKITVTFVESPEIQEIKKNKSIKNYIRNEDEFIFYIAGSMNDFVQFLSKYKIEQLYSDTSDLNETLLEYF